MLQSEALDILKLGHNVYLTGAAGSGKTYVLNKFIEYLKENKINVGVTASTGIAATHIGGMTIHSWSGIGIEEEITDSKLNELLTKTTLRRRISQTKVLIIDEVSMLHGKRLDMVDKVTRAIKDNNKPFGGMQVVLCGDLFQLPPVNKLRDKNSDFVFKAQVWSKMNLQICYLNEQHRQDDQTLLDLLNAIRASEIEEEHFETVKQRFLSPDAIIHTKLYTHNSAVDQINLKKLATIKSKSKTFYMNTAGNKRAVQVLIASCLAPEELELKIGAKVMFVANSQQDLYVNGTLGEIVDFNDENQPVVQTKDRKIIVQPHSWKTMDGDKVIATITQLPLRLAWAITIHKSQGMSLDAAEIDLKKSFEPGMGYVALSRVRNLEGLFIKGINNTAMMVHSEVSTIDKKLRSQSIINQTQLKKLNDKDLTKLHKRVTNALKPEEEKQLENYDKGLFIKLKNWRYSLAKKQNDPSYTILNNKTLKLIASVKPKNNNELAKIHGIGPKKIESYSKAILKITKDY